MSNVISLAEVREQRAEAKQIEALIRECNAMMLKYDPAKAQRVMTVRLVELLDQHGAQLQRLSPVIREVLLLRTAHLLVQSDPVTPADGAFAFACAAASLTDDTSFANEVPARIAALRAALPDEMRRMEKTYGKELLADPPTEPPSEK